MLPTKASMGARSSRSGIISGNMNHLVTGARRPRPPRPAVLQRRLHAVSYVGRNPLGPDVGVVLEDQALALCCLAFGFFHVRHSFVPARKGHYDTGTKIGDLRSILRLLFSQVW